MKKNICVCGHFGFGLNLMNGQTIKTKVVAEEIERLYGSDAVYKIDTHGIISVLMLPAKLFYALCVCRNIVILPAQRALLMESVFLRLLNVFFRKNIHYVVIGGWIANHLQKHPLVAASVKSFRGIYVEVKTLLHQLECLGCPNVYVLPNCKKLPIVENVSSSLTENKLRLVLFSRIMKEKGIEDAVAVVRKLNEMEDGKVYALDIYGPIDYNQIEWFNHVKKMFTPQINYRGEVQYENSVAVLKNYHLLLFPTYYEGECFAGTIIDAFASGLPVIASNWKFNSDVIENGRTGFLFKPHDEKDMIDKIIQLSDNPELRSEMSQNCIDMAKMYMPEFALRQLFENFL